MIVRTLRAALASLGLLALCTGTAMRPVPAHRAIGQFDLASLPYLPGSQIPLRVNGFDPPFSITLSGPLQRDGAYATVLSNAGASATLLAANAVGIAQRTVDVAVPPGGDIVAVAAYEDGVVFHEAASMRALAVWSIQGAPADVAIGPGAAIATGDTQNDGVAIAHRPWNVDHINGVPVVDRVAFGRDGSLYASNRGTTQNGQVTRIRDGAVTRVDVGNTPEGIVVNASGTRLYVANTNDGTVSIVDTVTMQQIARERVVDRAFSLALSRDGTMLYVTSNQSVGSPFGQAGGVVAASVAHDRIHVVRRSAPLEFPLGVAFDDASRRLFVTDEGNSTVYVLDARTLAPLREPLHTCRTPWEPHIDVQTQRLYVPCARADRIDVFDMRTLARVPGAPFLTGRYPLAVATWHGSVERVRY